MYDDGSFIFHMHQTTNSKNNMDISNFISNVRHLLDGTDVNELLSERDTLAYKLRTQRTSQDREARTHNTKLQQKDAEIAKIRKQLDAANSKNEALDNACIRLTEERAHDHQELGKARRAATRYKNQLEEAKQQLADKDDELSKLSSEFDSLKLNSKEEIESLTMERDAALHDVIKLKKERDKYSADNSKLQEEQRRLGASNKTLQAQLEKLDADNKAAKGQNATLSEKNITLQKDIKALRDKLNVTTQSKDSLTADVRDLKAQLTELERQNASLLSEQQRIQPYMNLVEQQIEHDATEKARTSLMSAIDHAKSKHSILITNQLNENLDKALAKASAILDKSAATKEQLAAAKKELESSLSDILTINEAEAQSMRSYVSSSVDKYGIGTTFLPELTEHEQASQLSIKVVFDVWKIARIRSAGNRKKCPLKKRWFQRTLYVCWVGSDCDDNF